MFAPPKEKLKLKYRKLLIPPVAALLFSMVGVAQEDTAALTGAVINPSQAVVPGAGVEIVNKHTGFLRTGRTNEYGRYYFNGIPIGVYQMIVRKDGFRAERF